MFVCAWAINTHMLWPVGFLLGQRPPNQGYPQHRPYSGGQGLQQSRGKPSNTYYNQSANQRPQNQGLPQPQSGATNQNDVNLKEDKPLAGQPANQNQQPKTKPTSVVTPFVPLQVFRLTIYIHLIKACVGMLYVSVNVLMVMVLNMSNVTLCQMLLLPECLLLIF